MRPRRQILLQLGQLVFYLLEGGAEVRDALLLLRNDLRRRTRDEAAVRELRLGLRDLGLPALGTPGCAIATGIAAWLALVPNNK